MTDTDDIHAPLHNVDNEEQSRKFIYFIQNVIFLLLTAVHKFAVIIMNIFGDLKTLKYYLFCWKMWYKELPKFEKEAVKGLSIVYMSTLESVIHILSN